MNDKVKKFSKQPGIPKTPTRMPPPLTCDSHGHIFPSQDLYPTVDKSMADAPVDLYLSTHKLLGIERGVLVQGGVYKHDNRAMLDALILHREELRGVALVGPNVTDAELESMYSAGVRALRFTAGGASRVTDLFQLAPRMKSLGLHAELFLGPKILGEIGADLLSLKIPIVLDHMGGPFTASDGTDDQDFKFMLKMIQKENVWVKLTPQRNSKDFPHYMDARPHFDLILKSGVDRLVWGTDWPFPNMGDKTPDPGELLDIFFDWTSNDESIAKKILVKNAAELYKF